MSKRLCRQCGETIPNRLRIDGKVHILRNRKFCIKCSPFMKHNTKPSLIPSQKVSKTMKNYKFWSKEDKLLHKARVYNRGLERKQKLIEMHGGKCIVCGYNKCQRALTFHHKDRLQKKFGLSVNNLWSKPWDIILEESNKCELLCANCHQEKEDALANVNETTYKNIIKNGFKN